MATFEEIMRAADKADKAGDADAARELVKMAIRIRGEAKPAGAAVAATGALQPKAYDPETYDFPKKVDRFGDTIAGVTKGPFNAMKAYGAGVFDQSKSPTMQQIPDWVPDRAKPAVARAGDTAMTGLAGLGTAYAFTAGAAGEALGGSPSRERQLANDLMAMGEVAVPQLAGVSGTVRAGAKMAKAADKLAQPATPLQASARAASDLDITPSLGAGGKIRAMTAAGLEKVPGVGAIIAKDAARFVDEVERAAGKITAKVGPNGSALDAGQSLQRGLNTYIDRFKVQSEKLLNDVREHIPADTKIQADNTSRIIAEALEPFKDSPKIAQELGLNKWAGIAGDLEQGISWKAASDLRSSIGQSIGKINGPLADMDQGRLKQAYAALTADLEAAAIAAGPEAKAAWARANGYYKRGATKIQDDLDRLVSADNPERAFEIVAGMAKEGRSTSDVKRLNRIRATMPQKEWGEVVSSIVGRLGRANPGAQDAAGGVFSPGKFLTEYNKLSPEGKAVLFAPEVRKELNDLAKVAERAKSAGAERNMSNTGTIVAGAGVAEGLFSAPFTTSALLAGGAITTKAMTSKPFLRALNKAARGDQGALKTLAKSGSPVAEDARVVLQLTGAEAAAIAPTANTDAVPPQVGIR